MSATGIAIKGTFGIKIVTINGGGAPANESTAPSAHDQSTTAIVFASTASAGIVRIRLCG